MAAFGLALGPTAAGAADGKAGETETAPADPAVTNHDGVPGTWLTGPQGFAAGVKEHREQNKPLLIYVYTDWCPYCDKFNRKVLPNEEVQACLDGFARVKLNPDRGQRDRALARQLRISGYPTLLVRQSEDIMLRPLQSMVSAQEFLQLCRRESAG